MTGKVREFCYTRYVGALIKGAAYILCIH